MKHLFTILLAVFCSTIVFAQSARRQLNISTNNKIAVYVTGKRVDASICEEVYNRLNSAILIQGKYEVVERSAHSLVQLQQEHIYQRSGNVDDKQIYRMGKQDGANIVCVAHINVMDKKVSLTVKLLNVERASIVRQERGSLKSLRNTNKLMKTVDEVAEKLLEIKLPKEHKGFQMSAEGMVFPKARKGGGNFIAGYRFNDFLSLGVGSGYYGYSGEHYKGSIIPLFADLRVNVLAYKLSPYFAVAGGVCIDRYTNTDTYVDPTGATQKYSTYQNFYGYFHASAGLHLRCSDAVAVFAGGGYNNMADAAVIQAGLSVTF
jgi:hypothetical protein